MRSLKTQIEDIRSDTTILTSDILVFTECHLTNAEPARNLHINGYSLFLNVSRYTTTCGTAIYINSKNTLTTKEVLNSNNIEITAVSVKTSSGMIQIVALYRSPAVSIQQFLQVLCIDNRRFQCCTATRQYRQTNTFITDELNKSFKE